MLSSLFLVLHVIAGFVTLILFWVPMFTRKGGKAHRKVGWIYVVAMTIVAISAFYLGMWRIFFDPDTHPDSISFYWFLLFISILSFATSWYGIRVLRFKGRKTTHRHPVDVGIPLLLTLSGVGISLYGNTLDSPLLTWFPLIGILLGISQLYYWLRLPAERIHWKIQHLTGLISCGIGTITAFVVFGAPRPSNRGSPTDHLVSAHHSAHPGNHRL